MNLVLLDIPNDPADWPEWLERELIGLELGDLVVQLQILTGPVEAPSPTLEEVCGSALGAVLQAGLSRLDEQQIRMLLAHPVLLLELQERLLTAGGEHWFSLPLTETQQKLVSEQGELIHVATAPHANPPQPIKPAYRSGPILSVLFAISAMLLLMIGLWVNRPAAPTWGFDRPGLFAAELPADEYLLALAQAATDWFNKRPETTTDLAKRLREFSHGCETLITAPHVPLSADDRDWLVERCRVWQEKLDKHLVELQAGAKSVQQVRDEADETVRQLIDALQSRASEVA